MLSNWNKPALAVSTLKDYMGLHLIGKGYKEDWNADHTALCALGGNWLVRTHKCRAVMIERGGAGKEMPDAIGFRYEDSYLIEAKMSRSDFLMDNKKEFRKHPEKGMGKYRYYICPTGLISAEEIPEKWGLLHVSKKGRIKKVKEAEEFTEYAKDKEYRFLTSALATPWKMFQHWGESSLKRLFTLKWVDQGTEVDLKLFAARLQVNRLEEADDE